MLGFLGAETSVPTRNPNEAKSTDRAPYTPGAQKQSSCITGADARFDQSSITKKQGVYERQRVSGPPVSSLQRLKADAIENHSMFQASWGMLMKHVEHPPGCRTFPFSQTLPKEPAIDSVEPAPVPQSQVQQPGLLLREPSLKHFSTASLSQLSTTQDKTGKDPKIGQVSIAKPPVIPEDDAHGNIQEVWQHATEAQPMSVPKENRMATETENELDVQPHSIPSGFRVASPSRIPSPPQSPRRGLKNTPSKTDVHSQDNGSREQLSKLAQKPGTSGSVKESPKKKPFQFSSGLKGNKKDQRNETASVKSTGPIRSFLAKEEKKETRIALGQHKVKVYSQAVL